MIEQFQGEHRWLSNFGFFETPLIYQGMAYLTNEHFYVAMKTKDVSIRKQVSDHNLKGLKKFGNTFQLRDDWESVKFDVMLHGLRYKFSENNPKLRQQLIATGDEHIQEGTWWNDRVWGIDLKTGIGENNLGRLLMQVRDELKGEIV